MSIETGKEPLAPQPVNWEDSISELARIRTEFLDACGAYCRYPSENNGEILAENGTNAINAVTTSVNAVLDDEDIDANEKGSIISGIIWGDDSLRGRYFQHLTPGFIPVEDRYEPETLADTIAASLSSSEKSKEVIDTICMTNIVNASSDINIFMNLANQGRGAKILKMKEVLGKGVISAAQTAVVIWAYNRVSEEIKNRNNLQTED